MNQNRAPWASWIARTVASVALANGCIDATTVYKVPPPAMMPPGDDGAAAGDDGPTGDEGGADAGADDVSDAAVASSEGFDRGPLAE